MNEEFFAENIARAIAKAYALGAKEENAYLSADDWASANWESFCAEAWDVIERTKTYKD